MTRIIAFSEKFWPEGSGGELATYLVSKLLASTKDFELEVYTGTQKPMQVPSVNIRTVDFLKAPNKLQLYLNIFRNKHSIEKIVKRADVVYIPRFSYPVIPIAKKLNKRVVVHLHDYQPVSYTAVILSSEVDKPMSDFKRTPNLEVKSGNLTRAIASTLATPLTKLIRRWVGMADKIMCVSRRHEKILLKLAPEYKEKTAVVYNPPPELPSTRKILSEEPTIIYVGGDSYVKGFYTFLNASYVLLLKKGIKAKLVMTQNFSSQTKALLEKLNHVFKNAYHLVGRVKHEEVLNLHSKAHALIFPSIWEEPLPYAVMEAMLLGTIPVASRIGGVPEIVEGTFAEKMMFSPGSFNELADRIETIVSMKREDLCEIGYKLREALLRKINNPELARTFTRLLYSVREG